MNFHVGSPSKFWQAGLLSALALAVWFPAFLGIHSSWKQPLYSQGPLVFALAVLQLVVRRHRFAATTINNRGMGLAGIGLLVFACGLFTFGRRTGIEPLVFWSAVPLCAAFLELMFGRPGLKAGAPAIALLCLTIPLPFSIESELLQSMQMLSTRLAEFGLQSTGVPVVASGNVIHLGTETLGIAEACSGLRLQWTLATLIVCWIAWRTDRIGQKLILNAISPAVTVLVNAGRIAALVAIWPWAARLGWSSLVHDFLGWSLLPVSLAVLWRILRWLPAATGSPVDATKLNESNAASSPLMVGHS